MNKDDRDIFENIEVVGEILKNQDQYLRMDNKQRLESMLNQYVAMFINMKTNKEYDVKS